jgi:hypothetical protein
MDVNKLDIVAENKMLDEENNFLRKDHFESVNKLKKLQEILRKCDPFLQKGHNPIFDECCACKNYRHYGHKECCEYVELINDEI